MNRYQKLKQSQQERFNAFPMFSAFNNKQFDEGMEKLGLKPTDTDKIYKASSTGVFYRKSDSNKLKEMMLNFEQELDTAVNDPKTGADFCYEMFSYELANHEYCITYDLMDAVNATGYSIDEINANKNLLSGLKKAMEEY